MGSEEVGKLSKLREMLLQPPGLGRSEAVRAFIQFESDFSGKFRGIIAEIRF